MLMPVNGGYHVTVTFTDRPPTLHQPIRDTISHHALPAFYYDRWNIFPQLHGAAEENFCPKVWLMCNI